MLFDVVTLGLICLIVFFGKTLVSEIFFQPLFHPGNITNMLCRPLPICARHTSLTLVGLRSFLVMHSEVSHIMHCYPSYYYTLDTQYTIININHLETYHTHITVVIIQNKKILKHI